MKIVTQQQVPYNLNLIYIIDWSNSKVYIEMLEKGNFVLWTELTYVYI